MPQTRFLIDTNIVVHLEDNKVIDPVYSTLSSLCHKHKVSLYVHDASIKDIERDKDLERKKIILTKLKKFSPIRTVLNPEIDTRETLVTKFGKLPKDNDLVDVELLSSLEVGVVDFLITEDLGIHKRAERVGIEGRVFTAKDAIDWLKQTYETHNVDLPRVEEKECYQIASYINKDPIFDSIRSDYSGFNEWFQNKCVAEHRKCWIVQEDKKLAGIVIKKDNDDAKLSFNAKKVMKVCTFKVAEDYRGEKLGEQLLKQILWYAHKNKYDGIYLTAYPEKQEFLINFLERFGFFVSSEISEGEIMLEKRLIPERAEEDLPPFEFHTKFYPKYRHDNEISKFFIPIKPKYHERLFPEIKPKVKSKQLSLFPDDNKEPNGVPGNTIRKVYLCRASSKQIKTGDILIFYKSESSFITSIGIIESIHEPRDFKELIQMTAKRSVYSSKEQEKLMEKGGKPLRVINFYLVGHFTKFIKLKELKDGKILKGAPQSISVTPNDNYKQIMKLTELRI